MPELKDIMIDSLTYDLLYENGHLDAKAGKSRQDGWDEICVLTGFANERTPAREAYEDGYYSRKD